MAKLKIISEKGSGDVFELEGTKISVGRDATNDITINDASVSRYHCTIEQRGEDFFITDLGSLNGTSVNGREADDTRLGSGDKIIIGYLTFRFFTGDAAIQYLTWAMELIEKRRDAEAERHVRAALEHLHKIQRRPPPA